MKKKVVIVMPAYFAEKTLKKTYKNISKELRIKENIILVDDASSDGTDRVAQRLGLKVVRHKNNLGYGGNQKTCYREALKLKPDIIVMIHPDYQYDSSMTNELVRPLIDGWLDIMLGNRIRTRKETLEGGMPLYKYIFNRVLTFIENVILGMNLGEYHTGFRAYKLEVLKKLPYEKFSNDFVFDQELLISASYSGFRIGEIAIPVRYSPDSSSISFKKSVKYGIETLISLYKFVLAKSKIIKFEIFN